MIPYQYILRDEFLEMSNKCIKSKKDQIKNSKEFILWAETKIDSLHQWLRNHDFENEIEEIEFFKEIKPNIISKLIYQKEILRIVTNLPSGEKLSLKYYKKELDKFSKNLHADPKLYGYYRSDSNEFDTIYFTRRTKKNILDTDSSQIGLDTKISTCYDTKIANILAHDKLIVYTEKQIKKLKNKIKEKKKVNDKFRLPQSKLQWTRKQSELIEFVYAIHHSKLLNHGNTDLKVIAREIGRVFNMNIKDNFYRVFRDIKNRKNSQSKFIQNFAADYQNKLDEENY